MPVDTSRLKRPIHRAVKPQAGEETLADRILDLFASRQLGATRGTAIIERISGENRILKRREREFKAASNGGICPGCSKKSLIELVGGALFCRKCSRLIVPPTVLLSEPTCRDITPGVDQWSGSIDNAEKTLEGRVSKWGWG